MNYQIVKRETQKWKEKKSEPEKIDKSSPRKEKNHTEKTQMESPTKSPKDSRIKLIQNEDKKISRNDVLKIDIVEKHLKEKDQPISLDRKGSGKTVFKEKRKRGEVPHYNPLTSSLPSFTTMIEDLFSYISESYSECLTEEKWRQLLLPVPESDEKLKNLINLIGEQLIAEEEHLRETANASKHNPTELKPAVAFPRQESISNFHVCRLLLNNLGFLNFENLKRFKLIDNGIKFVRHLHSLDKISGREHAKIGLIYVQEGQEQQYDIFRNDSGSKLYNEFASGLGWLIDLNTHQGYSGGYAVYPDLPAKDKGNTAYYYADRFFEVIFHEIVRMPTNLKDPHQLEKKEAHWK